MSNWNNEKIALAGAPLIGEGNIVDVRAMAHALTGAEISSAVFFTNGPLVRLARFCHTLMSMSTKKTLEYAFNSEVHRSSFKLNPLRWELKRDAGNARKRHPAAACFITSQNIIAEESVGTMGDIPTMIMSSDQNGKYTYESRPTIRQREINYLVWNREAMDFYKNGLGLKHVHLVVPADSRSAFKRVRRAELPFQDVLDEPRVCFIKLSGSGGDPRLINQAVASLWRKSRVRSVVFPGIKKTGRRIIERVGDDVPVRSSLDSAAFYNHAREIISNEQMLLVYPSEQLKHIILLTQEKVFPRVVWLPPRGQHEVINLAWAIKKGFSGTVCIPSEYQRELVGRLHGLGVDPSLVEFVLPERLAMEHFKPSPLWQYELEAVPFEDVVSTFVKNA